LRGVFFGVRGEGVAVFRCGEMECRAVPVMCEIGRAFDGLAHREIGDRVRAVDRGSKQGLIDGVFGRCGDGRGHQGRGGEDGGDEAAHKGSPELCWLGDRRF